MLLLASISGARMRGAIAELWQKQTSELLIIGKDSCWAWTHGKFDLPAIVLRLIDGLMEQHHWRKWLRGDKMHLLSLVVAHALCRVPVTRDTPVTSNPCVLWQELEHDGIVFIQSPGEHCSSLYVS